MAELPQYKPSVVAAPFQAPDVQDASAAVANKLMDFAGSVAGVAQKANKTAQDAELMQATIAIRQNSSKIRNDTLDHPTLTMNDTYNRTMNAWTKGYLPTLSPGVREKAMGIISEYQMQGNFITDSHQRRLSNNVIEENHLEFNTQRSKDAVNYAYQGANALDKSGKPILNKDGNPMPMSGVVAHEIYKGNQLMVATGKMSPLYAANSNKALADDIESSTYMGRYSRALRTGNPDDAIKWLKKFNDNKSIDPDLKYKLNIKFKGMASTVLNMQGNSLSSLKSDAQGDIQLVNAGKLSINDPKITQLLERLRLGGSKDIETVKQNLLIADHYSSVAKTWPTLTHSERNNMIHSFDLKTGMDAKTAYVNSKVKTQLLALNNKFNKQLKDDSFTATLNSPTVIAAQEEGSTATIGADGHKQQGLNPYPVSTIKASWIEQGKQGIPVDKRRVISKPGAADIVGNLNGMVDDHGNPDIMSRVQYLDKIAPSFGQFSSALSRNLYEANAPQNVMDLVGLDKIPESVSYLNTAYTAFSDPTAIKDRMKNETDTYNDMLGYASDALQDVFKTFPKGTGSDKFKQNMITNVALSASKLEIDGKQSGSKAAQTMADALYNNRFSYVSKNIRVPRSIPEDNAKAAIYAMEKNLDNVDFNPLVRAPSEIKLTPAQIKQEEMPVIKGGQWKTMPGAAGLYWVDKNGFTPTIKGTNKRYEIRWNDLDSSSSRLSNIIAKHPEGFFRRLF